ncbi:DUF58 domain-containing protein [Methylobacillus flagellatus]|uniref:MxaS, protein involved in methanol oxidation n=1 Tax=Methylobacillus flagellatus (strain ATCC 51484 / DSM 6875 / VKM B-1610 / KT) TaxID=265072 RepID=Q1GZN1_METFK|nr:DUF58 domain-containing protein [Methylobacillus flagellatus]ABE50306.1 MxaS, protein involved in methanol oxidation [Methylobacillus flagellatus KT]
MASFTPQEFYYHLRWRARGAQPGAHATCTPGGGTDFAGHVPFMDNPDPRRLDLRASLRVIPRRYVVRSFFERGAIVVYALLDLSASMRFAGNAEKKRLLADIAAAIAWSSTRHGDSFSLLACDDVVRQDIFLPPSFRRGLAQELHRKILDTEIRPQSGATGLPRAIEQVRPSRSLVFLISDFHLDEVLLSNTLTSFSAHDVVPLVLWDSSEYRDLPEWGWARVRDMEGKGERSIFLRRSLRREIEQRYLERKRELKKLCRQYGARAPFFIEDKFDAGLLTRHLLEAS